MKYIERNDVDISKLFRWGTRFPIELFGENKGYVYIRLLGDADNNRARVYALRKSAELRKKLNSDTEERLAFIPDIELLEKETLVEMILLGRVKDFTQTALTIVDKQPIPKEPDSTATLEQQEKYQAEVDAHPEKRDKKIREVIEELVEKERKALNVRTMESLFKDYEKTIINELCETEMISAYRDACVVFGCYSDEGFKDKVFNSVEDLNEVPKQIKDQLVEYYIALEINGEELKKSLEAVQ